MWHCLKHGEQVNNKKNSSAIYTLLQEGPQGAVFRPCGNWHTTLLSGLVQHPGQISAYTVSRYHHITSHFKLFSFNFFNLYLWRHSNLHTWLKMDRAIWTDIYLYCCIWHALISFSKKGWFYHFSQVYMTQKHLFAYKFVFYENESLVSYLNNVLYVALNQWTPLHVLCVVQYSWFFNTNVSVSHTHVCLCFFFVCRNRWLPQTVV